MQTVLITGLRQKITDATYGNVMRRQRSLWFDYVIDAGVSRPCTKYLPRIHPASYECSSAHDSTSPVCINITGTADGQGRYYHSISRNLLISGTCFVEEAAHGNVTLC